MICKTSSFSSFSVLTVFLGLWSLKVLSIYACCREHHIRTPSASLTWLCLQSLLHYCTNWNILYVSLKQRQFGKEQSYCNCPQLALCTLDRLDAGRRESVLNYLLSHLTSALGFSQPDKVVTENSPFLLHAHGNTSRSGYCRNMVNTCAHLWAPQPGTETVWTGSTRIVLISLLTDWKFRIFITLYKR